jgi:hypothetical protein
MSVVESKSDIEQTHELQVATPTTNTVEHDQDTAGSIIAVTAESNASSTADGKPISRLSMPSTENDTSGSVHGAHPASCGSCGGTCCVRRDFNVELASYRWSSDSNESKPAASHQTHVHNITRTHSSLSNHLAGAMSEMRERVRRFKHSKPPWLVE